MGNHKVLKTAGINLRYSMYDFIDAVKKHHIIWDREHKNFHNRELRDQAWQQIGQQLCKNFELANSAEKQEISKYGNLQFVFPSHILLFFSCSQDIAKTLEKYSR